MLLEQITSDIKEAMKNKEADKLLTLRTLKGEIQRKSDNPTDIEVISVIKKSIDGIKETTNDESEIALLDAYLPSKLTSEDLVSITDTFVKDNDLKGIASMGKVMNYFKENYTGQYDGKELSDVTKKALGV